jgi:hypothetical protein
MEGAITIDVVEMGCGSVNGTVPIAESLLQQCASSIPCVGIFLFSNCPARDCFVSEGSPWNSRCYKFRSSKVSQ